MSQNFSRGLENEYLVPYITFSSSPTGSVLAGGGTTTLTAVATASTGIGYLKYRWYADDVLSGGITTALSGVTTSRDFTLDYSGSSFTRDVDYKVSAEWVPDNPGLIVSHGTPGVGATGVGLGQSISGYSPSGETFSSVGIVSVSSAITASLVAIGTQPVGYNTSAYNQSRTLEVNATIANGDNSGLVYVWKSGSTVVSGATTSAYTFTPGSVGINTYTVTISYPTDTLVPSVTSDNIIDNSTDLSQKVRLEFFPAGAEKVASSSDYKIVSTEVNLNDHSDGLKIDIDYAHSIIGTRNTSVYAWDNYYYVSMHAIEDDLTIDMELGGARGANYDLEGTSLKEGGKGGWMVLQGTMKQNEEFVGIAATMNHNQPDLTDRPPTVIYELGSVIGIVGNGGAAGDVSAGGDGGADTSGESSANGTAGGVMYTSNTLSVEGDSSLPGRASRCPKGSSFYQNRYGACESFNEKLRDSDGVEYPVVTNSINSDITRGFKMTETNIINGGGGVEQSIRQGDGGSGATGGWDGPNGNTGGGDGGGGGSGYYGGNWTKLISLTGGNDGSVRTYEYGTDVSQSVTTDSDGFGYIRLFGRGGSVGSNPLVGDYTINVERNPSAVTVDGVYLDLTDFPSDKEVLVRFTRKNSNFSRNLTLALYTAGTYAYALQESSDISNLGLGTQLLTILNNQTQTEEWVTGGSRYSFRTADNDGTSSTNISALFIGGEAYGTGGTGSGGEFDLTVLGGESSSSANNSGTNADLRVSISIQGIRDT
mgnify:CR=1 FL=1